MKEVFKSTTIYTKNIIVSLVVILLLSSCSMPTRKEEFRIQACKAVYCDKTEDAISKQVAEDIISSLSKTYLGFDINTRNVCNKYYKERELSTNYIYLKKSAKEICNND